MHKMCFTISLFHASTCFEHRVLIVRRSKLYYIASGIIIPIGGLPVHRLRENFLPFIFLHQTHTTKHHKFTLTLNPPSLQNKTTDVVIQQHSRKFLMMDILISETC